MITNIYNKETKGPTLMELFTATAKLFFLQLEKFIVCRVIHRTSLVVKRKLFQCPCGCEQGRSFGFLVMNVCNHRARYEMHRIKGSWVDPTALYVAGVDFVILQ
jgi:hypothetical protein